MAISRSAGGGGVDAPAVDQDVAGGGVLEAGDDAQQRRLAAARGADEDAELAVADLEVDALDDVGGAEGLGDGLQGELAHGVAPQSLTGRPVRTLSSAARQTASEATASWRWRVRSWSSRDRAGDEGGLAVAERLVAGLVGHREVLDRAGRCGGGGSPRSWCGCRCRRSGRSRACGSRRRRSGRPRPSRRRRCRTSSGPSRPRTSRASRRRRAPGSGRSCTCRAAISSERRRPMPRTSTGFASVIWHMTST